MPRNTLSISNSAATRATNTIRDRLGARVLLCTLGVCELFEARGEDHNARAQILRDCGVSEAEMRRAQSIIMEHVDGGMIDG